MVQKTKDQTINALRKALLEIEDLYKSGCVNWTRITSDSNELYTEVIANELLQEIDRFDKIKRVTREKTYFVPDHVNIFINSNSNRGEEKFAKKLVDQDLGSLGRIKDYQIPLKNVRKDKLGKVDLVSYNEKTKTLYLIELKFEGNEETLLRAALEIFTYYKSVDIDKLKNDFCQSFNYSISPDEIKVKPVVLLYPECNAYRELEEVESGKRPKFKALAETLGIEFYTVEFLIKQRN